MDYQYIEKLAKIFEDRAFDKLAQMLPDIEEGGTTLTEDILPVAEKEISTKFSSILLKNYKQQYGELSVPPIVYVAITRFHDPGTEFTVGVGKEITEPILNKTILETDTWLKTESRYCNNQYMKNASWKVQVVQ